MEMSEVKATLEGRMVQRRTAATCERAGVSFRLLKRGWRWQITHHPDEVDCARGHAVLVNLANPRRAGKDTIASDRRDETGGGDDADGHVLVRERRAVSSTAIRVDARFGHSRREDR